MDHSDSDSAPEEENTNISAIRTKKALRESQASLAADKKKLKEKRRAQHDFFTKQKQLPTEILAALEDEGQDEKIPEPSEYKGAKIKGTKKSFDFVEKGPVTVKIVKDKRKSLAPRKDAVINKRESFLKRRSIRRK